MVLLLPAVSACELVLGLGDYTKGDGGDNFDGGLESSLPDAPADTNALPDAFTTPADWAKWRMPNPAFALPGDAGTNAKYNTSTIVSLGTVQIDGGSFDVFGDQYQGEDAGTGLQWLFLPAAGTADDFSQASATCASRGGRVPKRIELVTLIDFSAPSGQPRYVKGVPQGALLAQRYWTASVVRPYDPKVGTTYWAVIFDDQSTTLTGVAKPGDRVVCVRDK